MQGHDMAREKQINFRVSREEAERFERVAEHFGLGVSAMIRMLVKREAAQVPEKRVVLDAGAVETLFHLAHTLARRRAERAGLEMPPAGPQFSGIESRGGRTYFVLANHAGVLARFKVTPSGDLRLLKK